MATRTADGKTERGTTSAATIATEAGMKLIRGIFMDKNELQELVRLAARAGISADEIRAAKFCLAIDHATDMLQRAQRLLHVFCGEEKHDMGDVSMDLLCGGDDVNEGVELANEIKNYLGEG